MARYSRSIWYRQSLQSLKAIKESLLRVEENRTDVWHTLDGREFDSTSIELKYCLNLLTRLYIETDKKLSEVSNA